MLKVDVAKMHKVDPKNVENLYGMWSGKDSLFATFSSQLLIFSIIVFSKCADSMEDGRRLENLSWRIWNRETFCCETQPQSTTTPEINRSRSRPRTADIPELSASVESASSDASDQLDNRHSLRTAPVSFRSSPLRCTESVNAVSRGREKHISSLGLEKMVLSIKERQKMEPLSPSIADAVPTLMSSTDITPRPASPSMHAPLRSSESSSSTAPLSSPGSEHSSRQTVGSDTSAELIAPHSVVRGFSPNQVSSSYRSHTHLAPTPIPTKSVPHSKAEGSKMGGIFLLGGSSGDDDDSSFDEQMSCQQTRQSSLTAGLKLPLKGKKQTSFKDEVESRTINHKSHEDEEVFESDDEGDAPESAIEEEEEDDDDDDGSDWEDSISDSAEPLANDQQLFQRVDSRPNIISRRSLLTTLMHQPDRAAAFANMASKSASVVPRSRVSPSNGDSAGTSPEEEDSGLAMLPPNMTRSKPIIMTTSNIHPPALSPRTTRRNMLATELTQSLRKHLLWERQQKSTTANAVLKRRHTAHDVANLQEYPGQKPGLASNDGSKNNSWNHYFDHGLGEYHQTGW